MSAMGAIDCARAILKYVPDRDTAVTLVAIAGAESGWRLDAAGDCKPGYAPWICNAGDCRCGTTCSSFGPWQINIYWGRTWLPQMAGTSDPCGIARWLMASYDNNARAAAEVKRRQGFCAWYTYEKWCSEHHNGSYRNYLSQARAAVDQAISEGGSSGGGGEGSVVIPPPALPVAAALGAVLLGGAGAGLLIFLHREKVARWWYNSLGGLARR